LLGEEYRWVTRHWKEPVESPGADARAAWLSTWMDDDVLHALVEERRDVAEWTKALYQPQEDLPASQRENICKHVDKYVIDPDWRHGLRSVCESLDKLREMALAGRDTDQVMLETIARLDRLRGMSETSEVDQSHIVKAVEAVYAEDCRWLVNYKYGAARLPDSDT